MTKLRVLSLLNIHFSGLTPNLCPHVIARRHDEAISNTVEKIASASHFLRVLRNDEFQSLSPPVLSEVEMLERGWGEAAYFL